MVYDFGKEDAMMTDLYKVTTLAAFRKVGKENEHAAFDMFTRSFPKDWGYFVACGIENAIDYATNFRFTEEDIESLKNLDILKKADDGLFDYLERFRFNGNIYAVPEGTPLGQYTPLLMINGKRAEAQFIESRAMNLVKKPTMIASKASRIYNAAKRANASFVDFSLRDDNGRDEAMAVAYASYMAGANGTSNLAAYRDYGIPAFGTMDHGYVLSFPEEIDAFRAFNKTFPEKTAPLIDTYDTLEGAKKAATVGKEMEKNGEKMLAVRLDSGDVAGLAKGVRKILDKNELNYIGIMATNELDEYAIEEFGLENAPINSYGIGTKLATAGALPGAYKLVEDCFGARMKLSSGKRNWPGRKQVYRQENDNGGYLFDIMALEYEEVPGTPLLEMVVKDGKRVKPRKTLPEIREYCLDCISHLPDECKNVKAEPYKMEVTPRLAALADELEARFKKR